MTEPASIEIHCAAAEQPLPDAWVVVTLVMVSKNPYRLLFGPSDAQGVISVASDELRMKARREIDFFPMDYSTFPEAWTGTIEAELVDLGGVERLRSAIDLWGGESFPPDFRRVLNEYEEKLRCLGNARLKASVIHAA